MTWGNKVQIATALAVEGTELFSSLVSLNPGEQVHIEVECDFPASPTDNLVVAAYATLDDTSENWDDTAFLQFEIDKGTDPNKVAFIVSGFYKFRLGFVRAGGSQTLTTDAWIRKDGVNI